MVFYVFLVCNIFVYVNNIIKVILLKNDDNANQNDDNTNQR